MTDTLVYLPAWMKNSTKRKEYLNNMYRFIPLQKIYKFVKNSYIYYLRLYIHMYVCIKNYIEKKGNV